MATMNTSNSLAFSAPAQQSLFEKYGDPRVPGWENKWMHRWAVKEEFPWFPQAGIYLHRDFDTLLRKAFKSLEAHNCHQEIKTFDGCFNIRHVRGGYSVLSIHSWGVAIDLNARDNPLASSGKWSRKFIDIMVQSGLYCGQNWHGRKDPMHFALING